VKDVYQRVWLSEAQEGEPMRIIYRMRGLLGDATEEFIENLAIKESDEQVPTVFHRPSRLVRITYWR
jgi:E3 ubiquitin-protein ligase UBR4